MNEYRTQSIRRRGIFCFWLGFVLLAIAILTLNWFAIASILIVYICGYVSVSCSARVENGQWPLAAQRRKWNQ